MRFHGACNQLLIAAIKPKVSVTLPTGKHLAPPAAAVTAPHVHLQGACTPVRGFFPGLSHKRCKEIP